MIRARTQYEIATHPLLVKQLQSPILLVLEETLASHRYALGLDQDSADTLFNTAQVLTSMAEEIFKDDPASDSTAMAYLGEALELLQRCLTLQEFRYTESEEQAAEALQASEEVREESMSIDEAQGPSGIPDAGSEQAQWASIVEPVTKDTLIDTAIAQLSTLTTLCSVLGSSLEGTGGPSLGWVEEYSSKTLNVRLPILIEGTDRIAEVAVAKALFISAMLEAGFRRNTIDMQTFRRERDAAFSDLAMSSSFAALMANVASLLAFNTALSETESSPAAGAGLASLRWNALATAISNLATASKLPDAESEELPKTHSLRGDATLYQYQLSKPQLSYPPAIKNSAALLKNAEVFYRNASRLAHDEDERTKSRFQEAVVMSLQGNLGPARTQIEAITADQPERRVLDYVEEMVADGLLSEDDRNMIG
jgi:hypothetical protein